MKQKKNFFWRWESDYNTGSPHYRTAIWNQGKFAKMCLCINNKGCFFWPLLLLLWPENVLWLCRVLPKCYVIFNHNDPSVIRQYHQAIVDGSRWLKNLQYFEAVLNLFFLFLPIQTPREKCPNTELFSGLYFPAFDWIRRDTPSLCIFSSNAGKYGPKKLRIWTLFTQWKFPFV